MTEVFGESRPHVLGQVLNSGGQGVVFEVESTRELAIKIDLHPSDQRHGEPEAAARERYGRRIKAMITLMPAERWIRHVSVGSLSLTPHGHVLLAWPLEPVRQTRGGMIVGYLMARLDADLYYPIETLFRPIERSRLFPQATWRFYLDAAISLALLIDELHRAAIVVGDLSPPNLFVTAGGDVSLVDCDSMQFTDPASGEVFRCPVARLSFTPPEILGQNLQTYTRAKPADRFALAVTLCSLLLLGTHPHLGYPNEISSEDESDDVVTANVAKGRSHIFKEPTTDTPRAAVSADVLPKQVLTLARRCFGPGQRNPRRRPSASQWVTALRQARDGLAQCPRKSVHVFDADQSECPWCKYQASNGQDPFP